MLPPVLVVGARTCPAEFAWPRGDEHHDEKLAVASRVQKFAHAVARLAVGVAQKDDNDSAFEHSKYEKTYDLQEKEWQSRHDGSPVAGFGVGLGFLRLILALSQVTYDDKALLRLREGAAKPAALAASPYRHFPFRLLLVVAF